MSNEIEVEKSQEIKEELAKEEEVTEEEAERLPFPNAAIVRLMKNSMDGEKMIKKEVKLAMNKWLAGLCINVSKEMNRFPYVMMHLHEFKKATETYCNLERFQMEKNRILAHMAAIKMDIEKLERDLGVVDESFV